MLKTDRTKRVLWVLAQLVAIVLFFFSFSVVAEMTIARPNQSYVNEAGAQVHCEALIHASKRPFAPRCTMFGSKETNPFGYVVACLSLICVFGFFWQSGKPGRGLRF
jgi:hypothetical protein